MANRIERLRALLPRWLDRFQLSESAVVGGAALLVGLTSGAGVWLFKRLIDLAHTITYDGLGALLNPIGPWTLAVLPVVGGLVVGLLLHFFIGEERHHGVAGIMEAVALAGGRLRYKRIPAKAVAAAISIGSGAAVGPEDPSVQIGSNLGSMLGQWLHVSDDRVRTLVAAGAAGGIAAAFNAPIAGVFFALEIIQGELSAGMPAAVISVVFTQAVSGPQPAFHVPAYAFSSGAELPLYLGLGLVPGATILDSMGMRHLQQRQARRDGLPLMPSLRAMLEQEAFDHHTVFSIAPDEFDVDDLIRHTEELIGDFEAPQTGLLFVVPVLTVRGLRRHHD